MKKIFLLCILASATGLHAMQKNATPLDTAIKQRLGQAVAAAVSAHDTEWAEGLLDELKELQRGQRTEHDAKWIDQKIEKLNDKFWYEVESNYEEENSTHLGDYYDDSTSQGYSSEGEEEKQPGLFIKVASLLPENEENSDKAYTSESRSIEKAPTPPSAAESEEEMVEEVRVKEEKILTTADSQIFTDDFSALTQSTIYFVKDKQDLQEKLDSLKKEEDDLLHQKTLLDARKAKLENELKLLSMDMQQIQVTYKNKMDEKEYLMYDTQSGLEKLQKSQLSIKQRLDAILLVRAQAQHELRGVTSSAIEKLKQKKEDSEKNEQEIAELQAKLTELEKQKAAAEANTKTLSYAFDPLSGLYE